MALDRIYRLTCDSWSLIDLARDMPDQMRRSILGSCHLRSLNRATSTKARTAARSAGWVRHKEDILLNPDQPSAGTSTHRFDLCPSCAKALIEQ